ncbi:DEAD/DEAH box helicase [Actinacidiphila epipremni]|uniref:DEAD/DEAH box helicase n=1 Tax=Actinacidiphila epipremni TaxID=2053013 RepID=A0ABX0ZMU4_9ACTN|nr:SNF2-related protein [Actinacidiphila epipremni]NJP44571.1 DEAD/DEAH box helicase [Actinacidiphila epipremni]
MVGWGERKQRLREGWELREAARAVVGDHGAAVGEARRAYGVVRDEAAGRELGGMPVARLKDVTEGRLRLAAIEAAGYRSVAEVVAAGRYRLRQIPGVGPQTADQAVAAAGQFAQAVAEAVAVRFDVEVDVHARDPGQTALLVALHRLVEAGPAARRAVAAAEALERELEPLLAAAEPAAGRLRWWLGGRAARERALDALGRLRELAARAARDGVPELLRQASVDLLRDPAGEIEAWVDFEVRSADYYALLAQLSERGPDSAAAEGFLPSEVVERVREQPLDDTHLRVSLRGYQAFGARFALAQRRVVLGDEMGLGKTVQAVAALAHLAARGRTHFLVVCPAGVLVNWTREIAGRSALRAVPLHGPDRGDAFAEWRTGGGVAVTTYDALRGFAVPEEGDGAAPAMLVVDEAHYVKNPETRRSQAVAGWAARCERVLFLTGTPMENRVAEFRTLVRYLRPDLIPEEQGAGPGSGEGGGAGGGGGGGGARAFRAAVAPAYLRRNQRDVLAELPSLVRTDEWQELSAADQDAYREAVLAGNFMAMRRAAFARPEQSAKLARLRELVAEAAAGGLKVVVFSYFRDVLAVVGQALGAEGLPAGAGTGTGAGAGVHGPLTGSLAPAARQAVVDAFGAAPGHAVLLAQIEAGGVGLNLQAASVVILCEPQVKPTVEQQAVARAHRMGQVRTVHVHRLLATTGVDPRLLDILAAKSQLFDAYARRSDLADAAPDAIDVSDGSLARRIVEEEQARLAASAAPGAAPTSAPSPEPAPSPAPASEAASASAPGAGT